MQQSKKPTTTIYKNAHVQILPPGQGVKIMYDDATPRTERISPEDRAAINEYLMAPLGEVIIPPRELSRIIVNGGNIVYPPQSQKIEGYVERFAAFLRRTVGLPEAAQPSWVGSVTVETTKQ